VTSSNATTSIPPTVLLRLAGGRVRPDGGAGDEHARAGPRLFRSVHLKPCDCSAEVTNISVRTPGRSSPGGRMTPLGDDAIGRLQLAASWPDFVDHATPSSARSVAAEWARSTWRATRHSGGRRRQSLECRRRGSLPKPDFDPKRRSSPGWNTLGSSDHDVGQLTTAGVLRHEIRPGQMLLGSPRYGASLSERSPIFERIVSPSRSPCPRRHPPGSEAGQRHGRAVRRSAGHGLGNRENPRPPGTDEAPTLAAAPGRTAAAGLTEPARSSERPATWRPNRRGAIRPGSTIARTSSGSGPALYVAHGGAATRRPKPGCDAPACSQFQDPRALRAICETAMHRSPRRATRPPRRCR